MRRILILFISFIFITFSTLSQNVYSQQNIFLDKLKVIEKEDNINFTHQAKQVLAEEYLMQKESGDEYLVGVVYETRALSNSRSIECADIQRLTANLKYGKVLLYSIPKGAKVYLSGYAFYEPAVTPYERIFPLGDYIFILKMAGYEDEKIKMSIKSDEKPVKKTVTLKRKQDK